MPSTFVPKADHYTALKACDQVVHLPLPRGRLMACFRLRCRVPYGPDYQKRVAAVESAAGRIRGRRAYSVQEVPTDSGAFCDLYLHGTDPLDPGSELTLQTTGETFVRQIIP